MTSSTELRPADLQQRLASGALAGDWSLDPSRSSVRFQTKAMWGLVPVKGSFDSVEGTASVSSAGEVAATVSAAVSTINTKNKKRDTHLRSSDFFDSDNNPTLTLTVDGLVTSGDAPEATGTLVIAGTSRPVRLPVTVAQPSDDTARIDAEFPVDRSDYGMTWTKMGASLHNTISITAVFSRR